MGVLPPVDDQRYCSKLILLWIYRVGFSVLCSFVILEITMSLVAAAVSKALFKIPKCLTGEKGRKTVYFVREESN